jgi:GMP synthase (glutamine-hydrolysing)
MSHTALNHTALNRTARGPWAVLQHVPFEGPGLITEVAAAHGLDLVVHRLDRGEPLPVAGEVAGLVVMGGPMGAHDDADHPWLAAERDLLATAVGRGVPVLGVCLGAQLLAAALGARVVPGPAPEIGLGTVTLTDDGLADPVLGPAGPDLPVLHWHGDTFDLPDGAVLLASSDRYRHQAFRLGTRAYGLQFHVEIGTAEAEGLRPHLPAGADLPVAGVGEVGTAGRAVLHRLLTRLTDPAA